MKNILFSTLVLSVLWSCQSNETATITEKISTIPVNGIDSEVGNGTIEYDPVMAKINLRDITRQKQDELFALSKRVKQRAVDLRPFPRVEAGHKPTLSVGDADARYRVNALKLVDDIALTVYQQKYAKRMFIDYELLESKDYTRIEYYASQLLDGHSMDYEIISGAMQRLASHIASEQYVFLLNRATLAAEKQLLMQQKAIETFEKMPKLADSQNSQTASRQESFWKREAQYSINRMKSSRLPEHVTQLHKLQKSFQ